MNLVQLIKKMKPNQRLSLQKMLESKNVEVVKQLEPYQMKVGATIQDPTGQVTFIKTDIGWRTDTCMTSEQIVTKLVSPDVAQVVCEGLNKTCVGESYTLLPTSLRVDGLGNEGNKLTFERTSQGFVDPTFITDDQMKSIVENFSNTIKS
jgi:hypothetical protein